MSENDTQRIFEKLDKLNKEKAKQKGDVK